MPYLHRFPNQKNKTKRPTTKTTTTLTMVVNRNRIRSLLLAMAIVPAAGRWHKIEMPRTFLSSFCISRACYRLFPFVSFNFSSISLFFSAVRFVTYLFASTRFFFISSCLVQANLRLFFSSVFREPKLMDVAFNLNRFACGVACRTAMTKRPVRPFCATHHPIYVNGFD